ncbi:MAG TPA: ribosomal L7Ae/L30e/S12e/Gadd45 family protein [Gemmatimonadales bacterium]|nr:ribosomal L7Ae/L30e/S12e/Gadd45 family protein [Gemmatimonadales bacterium]
MTPLLRLLGLGRRGGGLVIGVDAVRRHLQSEGIRCVVLASDASPRAIEKVVRLASGKQVPLVAGPDAATIGVQLGKPPVMAVGVRDRGLADGILQSAPMRQWTED